MKNKTTTTKNPLVSVVMPAYNAENYIAEAIESILNQTYKNFEFIIVNDGSTDNTLNIIKRYAKKDKRIIIIDHKERKGISETRNNGLRAAKGKYIATHDSDDMSMPDRFQEQVNYLNKNPKVGVVGGFIDIFDDTTSKNLGIRKYPEKDEDLRKMVFFCSPIAQPASMIRKQVFNEIGFYREIDAPSEDLNLWFRLGERFKFANIQKVVIKYRYHPHSMTGSKLRLMENRANKIRLKNWDNPHYHFGTKAFLYNWLHFMSLYIIPSKFKLWLFSKVRDSKK